MESFFGTFKHEVGDTFIDEDDAKAAALTFKRSTTVREGTPL